MILLSRLENNHYENEKTVRVAEEPLYTLFVYSGCPLKIYLFIQQTIISLF